MILQRKTVFLAALLVLLLAGCAPVSPQAGAAAPAAPESAIPAVTIRTKDYSFEGPDELPAGLLSVTIVNDGPQPHHIQLARLNDGVTLDDLNAALQQSPEAALPLVSLEGGPGVVPAQGVQTVTMNVPAGQYVLVCFVPDVKDGLPHLAHGMIQPITVVEQAGAQTAQEPAADMEVEMRDFAFTIPVEVGAGAQTWKVTNKGQQPHEVALIKLGEGKTMDDVMHFLEQPEGAPPFTDAGGLQAIMPGASAWIDLELTPGTYVALCHVPDPASGKAHEELGMMTVFQVQ